MLAISVHSNIRVREGAAYNTLAFTSQALLRKIENSTFRIIREFAPVGKTGTFAKSFKKIGYRSNSFEGAFNGFIVIKSISPKALYILRKTRPSKGAYIHVLGKRYKKNNPNSRGMHPGTKANNFMIKAKIATILAAQVLANDHYKKRKFDVSQFIK